MKLTVRSVVRYVNGSGRLQFQENNLELFFGKSPDDIAALVGKSIILTPIAVICDDMVIAERRKYMDIVFRSVHE